MTTKERLEELSEEEIEKLLNLWTETKKQEPCPEEEKEHYYEFTGTWSWGTWAKSKEEAEKYLKLSYAEDFDLFTDEYTVYQTD